MAKQTINQGTAPTGAGGDTFRSGSAKLQANDNEIYNYLGDGTNLNKLGTAAFKNAGTDAGNVMEVGAFGVGGIGRRASANTTLDFVKEYYGKSEFCGLNEGLVGAGLPNYSAGFFSTVANTYAFITIGAFYGEVVALSGISPEENNQPLKTVMRTDRNTTVDANGFLKSASPIVKVFAEKIELNEEAGQQNISFEKLDVGNYLIKGSSGFAQEGWYIETPKDANGNLLVAVVYEQLANGDISVKTYDYMLNKKGRIVADTETPLDIPENRWIDLRLQELPQPEIEVTDEPEQ
ncbi:MAG: phage tail protein [Acinetobacter johnsonii]|nr:MAG: phage tail protein [Acinetobacter johnsonii]